MKKLLPFAAFAAVLTLPLLAMAADIDIIQKHQIFSQEAITIKAGDKLVMKNEDTVKHNIVVISQDGDSDDKGIQKPGEDITVPFATPGSYKVRCNIHSTMKLNVTVQ